MRNTSRIDLALVVGACIVSSGMTRAQLATDVAIDLDKREQRFSDKTFVWRLNSDIVQMQRSRSATFTMPNGEKREYKSVMLAEPPEAHFQNVWRFQRDHGQTLVQGEIVFPKPYEPTMRYEHLYTGNVGLSANVFMRPKDLPEWHPWTPEVWDCPGDAVRFRSPSQKNLDLWPEDFAMLAGNNPLAMYAATWHLISSTSSSLVVASTIPKGNWAPYEIRMTLDREHGNLPSLIKIASYGIQAVYTARHFTRYGQDWMPAEVECVFDMKKIIHRRRHWTLQNINQSLPINFTVPHRNIPVMDFRLLGSNLTTKDLIQAAERKDPYVVTYRWTGRIPDRKELESLAKSPTFDPQPTRHDWLLWIPALLLVAGGRLWLWKMQPNNGEKGSTS